MIRSTPVLSTVWRHCLVVGLLLIPAAASGGGYVPLHGRDVPEAELKYINDLPVLRLEGTPAEMGNWRRADRAGGEVSYRLSKELLSLIGWQQEWSKLIELGLSMRGQFPKAHLAELESYAQAAQLPRDVLMGPSQMVDSYGAMSSVRRCWSTRHALPRRACLAIVPTISRSRQAAQVYARHRYRPTNNMPLSGDLSGFVRLLVGDERRRAGDRGARGLFRATNFCVRRRRRAVSITFRGHFEECTTIDEAEALFRSMKRTTRLNLAVCDRHWMRRAGVHAEDRGARRGEEGICACANHFGKELGDVHLVVPLSDAQPQSLPACLADGP